MPRRAYEIRVHLTNRTSEDKEIDCKIKQYEMNSITAFHSCYTQYIIVGMVIIYSLLITRKSYQVSKLNL